MNQISAKVNNYTNKTGIMTNNIERITLRFIFGALGVLGLVYLLVLGTTVSNIIARKVLESNARALSNEVNNLEINYLAMSNNINLNLSHSLGFKEIKANFATRKSFGLLSSVKISKNDI